eukprot:2079958-Pyramimonas_sp.AAC.1
MPFSTSGEGDVVQILFSSVPYLGRKAWDYVMHLADTRVLQVRRTRLGLCRTNGTNWHRKTNLDFSPMQLGPR